MQQYTLYFYICKLLYLFRGGISIHHQEFISLYLQYLALMRSLLLPVVNVTGWELGSHPVTIQFTVQLFRSTPVRR